MCQCESGTFQPNCCEQDTCPTTGRPIQLHFAPGVDHSIARLMYFATRDEVCPNMYAISANKWKHDSDEKSNLTLAFF